MAELRKKAKEEIHKSISDAETSLKNFAGDIRKSMQQAIGMMKDQLKQLDDPNNPMYSAEMDEMRKKGYEMQVQDFQTKLGEWEKQYPISPNSMIKDRLNYFLQLSATVDFNAKHQVAEGGKMVFINPEYESKPSDWKFIFRSGKESSDAARAVAQQWLGELK